MCNCDDAVPLDHTDLNEDTGDIRADEHRHRIVQHEVPDGKPQCMEHGLIGDTVPVGTVEDDGAVLHDPRLLAAKKLGKGTNSSFLASIPDRPSRAKMGPFGLYSARLSRRSIAWHVEPADQRRSELLDGLAPSWSIWSLVWMPSSTGSWSHLWERASLSKRCCGPMVRCDAGWIT